MSPSKSLPARKATLYCTGCNHANLINGDWTIQIRSDSLRYECPECGTLIDSTRDRGDLTQQSDGSLSFRN